MTTLTYGVRIHAFVLMSNHFHMLLTAPNENMEQAANSLLRDVSRTINGISAPESPVFEEKCHWSLIKNRLYYEHAYKYVYRNPIEARICARVERYPYSTLQGLLGLSHLPFPAFDNLNLITNTGAQLKWLNSPYPQLEYLDDIRAALRRPEFEFLPEKGSDQPSPLAFHRF